MSLNKQTKNVDKTGDNAKKSYHNFFIEKK